MVLAGSGVYRDADHINNPKAVFFCDLDLNGQEVSNCKGLCIYFCHPVDSTDIYHHIEQK